MPLNYDAISALTRRKYVPELVDQFFNSHALLAKLRARQKPWDGGTQIVQPISYGELSGGKSFSGFDTVSGAHQMKSPAAMGTYASRYKSSGWSGKSKGVGPRDQGQETACKSEERTLVIPGPGASAALGLFIWCAPLTASESLGLQRWPTGLKREERER